MKKLSSKNFILLIIFVILNSCSEKENDINMKTVESVNIEKYMGKWYEIARLPNSFEKNLVGVTATYTLKENGKIEVLNQGYKNTLSGKHKKTQGKAKMPDKNEPGKLKVSFFLFFYSDYYILELDENYNYALVGSSSPEYLWILSRTKKMDKKTYSKLVENAKNRGYDTDKLILVKQEK